MANAIITFKIMPNDAGIDLEPIKEKAKEILSNLNAKGELKIEEQPIAFGLKAVMVKAMFEVEGNDFEAIAQKLGDIENIQTAEIASMDLPLG